MRELQANYSGAQPSRFRRTRTLLGGSADSHYVMMQDFRNLREYARDYDRNDAVPGQLVDRVASNVIQTGMALHPDTGEPEIDAFLRDRFEAWGNDPLQCDAGGKLCFPEMERLVLRHEIIDGDAFVLPLDDGTIQLVEGDRVDSPMQYGGDVIHGVKIDKAGRPLEYWFIQEREGTRFTHSQYLPLGTGYDKRPARDEEGFPNVLHVFNPKRISQSRGITAFAPLFDTMGMTEDLLFATLVKQQMAACVMAFLERAQDFQMGARQSESQSDGSAQTLEEMSPGAILRGRIGEKLTAFNPNIPANEFFEHVRLLLRMLGANLGMPLELVLLDFTQTNFSGHRAALQQARLGFEVMQQSFPRRFHSPVYRLKVRDWLPELRARFGDAAIAAIGPRIYKHDWRGKGWPYIDPLTDAQADKVRVDNMFASPRTIASERGEDYDQLVAETVEDNRKRIEAAKKAAEALSTDEDPVSWREVLNLSTPAGITQTKAIADPAQIQAQKDAAAEKQKSDDKKADDVKASEVRAIIAESEARMMRAMAEMRAPAAAPAVPAMQFNGESHITLPENTTASLLAQLEQKPTVIEKVVVQLEKGAIENNFAPVNNLEQTIEAMAGKVEVENKVTVDARLPPRPARAALIKHADGSESSIVTTE